MLTRLIDASVRWRYPVILLCVAVGLAGSMAYRSLILDALPDISDAQVIVQASFGGRTPEQIERQVTYPLASALASTSGAEAVREAGLKFAVQQIRTLLDNGAPGIHLYTLNKASMCLRIAEEVGAL